MIVNFSVPNFKMSGKLLKNIDWLVAVPSDYASTKMIESSVFTIEYNGNITKWKLLHIFNGEETYYVKKLIPGSYICFFVVFI